MTRSQHNARPHPENAEMAHGRKTRLICALPRVCHAILKLLHIFISLGSGQTYKLIRGAISTTWIPISEHPNLWSLMTGLVVSAIQLLANFEHPVEKYKHRFWRCSGSAAVTSAFPSCATLAVFPMADCRSGGSRVGGGGATSWRQNVAVAGPSWGARKHKVIKWRYRVTDRRAPSWHGRPQISRWKKRQLSRCSPRRQITEPQVEGMVDGGGAAAENSKPECCPDRSISPCRKLSSYSSVLHVRPLHADRNLRPAAARVHVRRPRNCAVERGNGNVAITSECLNAELNA